MWLVLLGLVAGAVTTVAGMGGGMLLLLGLSLLLDPMTALAVSAPALLVGNTHRAVLFRHTIRREVAVPFVIGSLPGALAGGLLAGAAPAWLLEIAMVGMTGVALARSAGRLSFRAPPIVLVPAGLSVGLLAATSGGGVLASPVLRAAGLSGESFVATSSTIAVFMHASRWLGYGLAGHATEANLESSAVVALAIVIGNAVGRALRRRLTSGRLAFAENLTLCTCVGLALLTLAK